MSELVSKTAQVSIASKSDAATRSDSPRPRGAVSSAANDNDHVDVDGIDDDAGALLLRALEAECGGNDVTPPPKSTLHTLPPLPPELWLMILGRLYGVDLMVDGKEE
jgi:hypothetical protein